MWFDPKRLETDALRKIIRSNRNRLEIEMAELLLDIMASVGVQRGATPLAPCGYDRRQADTDKQVCTTSKTRNEHGIYQHPNQQGERVG